MYTTSKPLSKSIQSSTLACKSDKYQTVVVMSHWYSKAVQRRHAISRFDPEQLNTLDVSTEALISVILHMQILPLKFQIVVFVFFGIAYFGLFFSCITLYTFDVDVLKQLKEHQNN